MPSKLLRNPVFNALLTWFLFLWTNNANAQVNLSNGLLAHYPFNGSFNDVSGNGNHGTAMNGTSFRADQWGNVNSAAFFDGVNDWVDVGIPSFTFGQNFTIAFRYMTNSTATTTLVSRSDYTSVPDNAQFQIGFNHPGFSAKGVFLGTNHTGSCVMSSSGNFTDYTIAQGNVSTEQWNCVVMTFSNGVKSIYVNGSLVASQTVIAGANSGKVDSCTTGSFRMGTWWQGDPLYFSGLMDEMRVYNRALTAIEADSLCKLKTQAPALVREAESRDNFALLPNPVKESSTLQCGKGWYGGTLSVFAINGHLVYHTRIFGANTLLDLRGMESGCYFYQLKSLEGFSKQGKVIYTEQ